MTTVTSLRSGLRGAAAEHPSQTQSIRHRHLSVYDNRHPGGSMFL